MEVLEPSISYLKPSLIPHSFSVKVGDKTVLYLTFKLNSSLFVWIGYANDPNMDNFVIAMQTSFQSSPIATEVFGGLSDSCGIATRLAKKLSKPVYLSCNIELDALTLRGVEKGLVQEVNNHSEYF